MTKLFREDMIRKVDEAHYDDNNGGVAVLIEDWHGFRVLHKIHYLNDEKQGSLFNTEDQFYILDYRENDKDADFYLVSNHVGIQFMQLSRQTDVDYIKSYIKSDGTGYILYQLKLITKQYFDEVSVEEYHSVKDGTEKY